MEWREEAIVLAARRHGESGIVAQLLTQAHGRHAGLVHGGAGRRGRALVEVGNLVVATWRGRLPEQLGTVKLELVRATSAALIERPGPLAALASACALLAAALPERAPHPAAVTSLLTLIEALENGDDAWPAAYVRWELGLLGELGFGLDLARCAATGASDDLAFVSPKSGRAVSRAAAEPFKDRLLPLPGFLVGRGTPEPAAIAAGLALTGHFLERQVFEPASRKLPPARQRLAELAARLAAA